ncbi:MAG: 6-hydroxymethylpterin diphosphokinase MptE-like protein [Nitrososphaerota archaeon]
MAETPSGWYEWYRIIVEDFGYSVEKDSEASSILASQMNDRPCLIPSLRRLVSGRGTVVVAGASDSIDEEAKQLLELGHRDKYVIFSADSATGALLEAGLTPDIVVTDMDGKMEELLDAWSRGAVLIIHAHGDNIPKVADIGKLFNERIEATCQSEPKGHIHNFGGFTDGDRAVFIAAGLGATKIITIGMCLTCRIGQRSKKSKNITQEWLKAKKKKLSYAQKLLSWLTTIRPEIEFIDATTNNNPPSGIKKKQLNIVIKNL